MSAAVVAHALAQAVVAGEALEPLGELLGRAGLDEVAVLAVLDDVGTPPTRVATTGRRAASDSIALTGVPSFTDGRIIASNAAYQRAPSVLPVPERDADDAAGNETQSGSRTFTYNVAGQLLQVANGSTALASFAYDGLGNRLTKTVGSTTTSYQWDENAPLAQLAAEKNGATLLRSYVYGADLISMTSGGSAYYMHADSLGSVVAVTNASGQIETKDSYDPFGNKRSHQNVDPSAPAVVAQFTGQLLDPETGLYDLRARTYDPISGRFLSTDSMPEAPADPAMADYLYASADPTLLVDPTGRSVFCDEEGNCRVVLNPGRDTRVFLAEPGQGNVLVSGSYTPPSSGGGGSNTGGSNGDGGGGNGSGGSGPAGGSLLNGPLACDRQGDLPPCQNRGKAHARLPIPTTNYKQDIDNDPFWRSHFNADAVQRYEQQAETILVGLVDSGAISLAEARARMLVLARALSAYGTLHVWGGGHASGYDLNPSPGGPNSQETAQWAATHVGFDCSGLVEYAYKSVDRSIVGVAASEYHETKNVSAGQLRPGDLVFYESLGHIGIYLGNGKIVDSPQTFIKGSTTQHAFVTVDSANSPGGNSQDPIGYGRSNAFAGGSRRRP